MKRLPKRTPWVFILGLRKELLVILMLILILGAGAVWLGSGLAWLGLGPASPEVSSEPVLEYQVAADSEIVFQTEPVLPELPESVGEGYFVDYRLQREQAHQEAKDMLEILLNSEAEQTREEAEAVWLELINEIAVESEIENLLKLKGFTDVIANVGSDNVSVVIYASSLTPDQVSLIQDTVLRIHTVRLDRITISVMK